MANTGERPLINDVSDTALWVAAYRAMESERPDALFHDPLAKILSGEKGAWIARHMSASSHTQFSVVIRTRIIDDYIREQVTAVDDGVDLVINLGAGLDARPYRLKLPPELRWIEVDFPHTIERKNELLKNETPRCRLERHAVNLTDKEARRKFLTESCASARKVLVLTEGVIPYLSEDEAAALAQDLRAQAKVHAWILEYFAPGLKRYLNNPRRRREMKNAPFRFFPEDWTGFFQHLGWEVDQMRYLTEEAHKLGRRFPFSWRALLFLVFSSRRKRETMNRLSGYALMRPQNSSPRDA